ncbi:PREDICTED: gustatory receptor 8a [Bactrocera latifrons]|nr:PREDICTED: gustatory receptor 8a [Bactrocera latifrons]
MHKQVPFVVRFHTRLFQIIGCCDVSWQTQPREKRLSEQRLVAWTVLVLLIYSFVFINTFVHPSAFLFTSESFGYFVDALKVCLAYVTVAIIYTETVLRRHALQHFWQRYALLNPASNQQVEPVKIDWNSQLRAYHRFLYVFYGITVLDLILEIIYYVMRAKDDHMLQFLLMFTPYTYMIHLRNMQIIFHIVIINHELVKLRHDIGLLAEYTRFTRNTMPFVGFEDFVRQKLAEKQLIYQRIYEMCDYFQQALGISTIAVLLMTYVRLVVDAYFTLYSFHTESQPEYIAHSSVESFAMTIQVPSVVRLHIRFFQLIGCFDVSLHGHAKVQRVTEQRLVTLTLLLLLLFFVTTVNTFLRPTEFLYTANRFGYFNDVLKVCIAQLTVFIIYMETVLGRHALRNFWQRYALLNKINADKFKSSNDNWRVQLKTYRRFLCIFYGITLFDVSIEVVFHIMRPANRNLLLFWTMFTPFMYMAHFRNMQIILHIEIIRHELKKLRHDIGLLAAYTSFSRLIVPFAGFERYVRHKLAEKQLVYQRIYEMLYDFQRAFSMSSMAVLLMIYVRVVVDAYFMFLSYSSGWQILENLLLLPAYLEIPALLLTSQKCMNEVKFIAFELHNIRSSVDNSLISIQIQNFSLQILHQKIRIDGLGISALDGKMLVSIVGSITTYMVFFIQFMPKFKNL